MKRRSFIGLMVAALGAVCTPVATAASRAARVDHLAAWPSLFGRRIEFDRPMGVVPLAEWLIEPHEGAYLVPGDWGPGSDAATAMPRQWGDRWFLWRATERVHVGEVSWVRFQRDGTFFWDREPVRNL